MDERRVDGFLFQNLRTYREKAGLSRAALAKAAEVDRGTIARAETGQHARKETLIRIGNALNDIYYRKYGAPIDLDCEISSTALQSMDATTNR